MTNKNTKIFGGLLMVGAIASVILAMGFTEKASALNYVTCPTGPGNICQGTSGDDYIWGTANADIIYGAGGDDIIIGNAGNDWINGDGGHMGTGCNTTGCEGDDIIYGGDGNDLIHHDGNQNNHNAQDYRVDRIHCGDGDYDSVFYKPTGDNDTLYNGHGCEYIYTNDS